MQKTIKSGTSISDTVSAIETSLSTNGGVAVVLTASANAISKVITIVEIVKRKDTEVEQVNRLFKTHDTRKTRVNKEDAAAAVAAEVEEQAEAEAFEQVELSARDKFQPCLEITLSRRAMAAT